MSEAPLTLPDVGGMEPKEAALAYASHGWPVFPCTAANHDAVKGSWSKKPHPMLREEEAARGEGGWKLATLDQDKITEWWDKDPHALIGISPGLAGAVVLDADGRDGIKALYDLAENLDLAYTVTSRTPGKGGGLHVWFDRRSRNGVIGNGSLRKVPGEARGDRGYVIVPPSYLPDGGKYEFTGHTYDLAPLPGWAHDILPWEVEGSIRASIAEITRGDEQEWLIARGAPFTDRNGRDALDRAVADIKNAVPRDVDRGRHPTAIRHIASILSKAQRNEFAVDLISAINEIREALLSVKPNGGPDFDRFVADAVAMRVAEDRKKAGSTVDWTQLRRVREEEAVWEDPADLTPQKRGSGLPFPTAVLPEVMRRAVEEVALATQVSEVLPAMAALGAASAATANGFVVSLSPIWLEGLSLWFIGVADPSERKTAVLKPFTDSIRFAASEWTTRTATERAEWDAEGAGLEQRLKEARKLAHTPEGAQEMTLVTLSIEDHEREGQRFIKPDRIVHADPTQEALIMEMQQQHGCAFIASSEGAFIGTLAGRYQSGGDGRNDMSIVNEAYSRSFIRSTRVTRGDASVQYPHLTIVSFIQPRIAEMLANPDFEASGFLSRVFYANPPSLVGHRGTKLGGSSQRYGIIMDRFRQRMSDIFTRGWGKEADPNVMAIHPDAVGAFEAWWARCETLAPADPWWGKAHGGVIRVAAILELVENPRATHVTEGSVAAATAILEFFAGERARMRETILDGGITYQLSQGMRRMLEAIARRWESIDKAEGISLRDLCRWLHMKRDEAYSVAEQMVERGWLAEGAEGRYLPHPAIPMAVGEDGKVLADASGDTFDVTHVSQGVTRLSRVLSQPKTQSVPGESGKNDPSVTVVTPPPPARVLSRVAEGTCVCFSSSSSSSIQQHSSQCPLAQPEAPNTHIPEERVTTVTNPERVDQHRGNRVSQGVVTARDARDTSTPEMGETGKGLVTSTRDTRDTLSASVDKVLAEPEISKHLKSMAGANFDDPKYDSPSDKRCPTCGKLTGTMPNGSRRCAEHGEVA